MEGFNVEITNMVMLYDRERDTVLVQNRTRSWPGLAFPGGHLEWDESLARSAAREVYEETGLTVEGLRLCGMIHWSRKNTSRKTLIFYYRAESFSGSLKSSSEGECFWLPLPVLLGETVGGVSLETLGMKLAPGFERQLRVFLDVDKSELFIDIGDGDKYTYEWN